jgi:hypothetical protein
MSRSALLSPTGVFANACHSFWSPTNSRTSPRTPFGDILSEARKWGLGLVLAHQFLEQLPPKLRAAVLANVGSIIAFQLASEDADVIAREVGLKKENADLLTQLSRGEVWVMHASYGGPYHPRLLDPIVTNAKGREGALKQNALRNTYPRQRVEVAIDRFLKPDQVASRAHLALAWH